MKQRAAWWAGLVLLLGGWVLPEPGRAGISPMQVDSLRQLLRWPVAKQIWLLEERASLASGPVAERWLSRKRELQPSVRESLYMHICDYYFLSNRPSLVALYGQEWRQLTIETQDSAGHSRAGAALSYAYSLLNQGQQALKTAQEAVRFAHAPGKGNQLERGYGMISIAAATLHRPDLELLAERKSLALARQHHSPENVAIGLQNMAEIMLKMHHDREAAQYLDSAAAVNHVLAATERETMPVLYATLALHRGQPQESVRLLLPPVNLARRDGRQYFEEEALVVLIPALAQLGRYREALAYEQHLAALREHLHQEATLRHGQELQTIYETERRDQELAQQRQHIAALQARQQREAATQRQRLLLLAGALALAGLGLLLLARRRRRARQRHEEDLRSQIAADLHDEVGTLLTRVNMQAELLRDTQPEVASPALDRLLTNSRTAARTMRDIVWGIDAHSDTVGALLDRMRDHLDQSATPAGLQTELITDGLRDEAALRAEVRQQLYLIFKEAVTNTVRHAWQATQLQVQLHQKGRHLRLVVQDDGQLNTSPTGRSGLGLRSMQQRAEAVGGTLQAGRDESAGGFRVEAQLPF